MWHFFVNCFSQMTGARPLILVILCMLICSGCIERYYPREDELKPGTLVVIAHLDNSYNVQTIYMSRSTDLKLPLKVPVSGCLVQVEEIGGRTLEFFEDEEGEYLGWTGGEFFRTGSAYKLRIVTPEAEQYESELESMYKSPAIDSVYWIIEELPGTDPQFTRDGIQFYIDYRIDRDSARYLRWQLEETYEYQNPVYESMSDYWGKPIPGDLWTRVCWITNQLPGIFTMDLAGVEGEVYRQMPLNYVDNHSQRLKYRYSLLARQFAISASAYWYWEGLKTNLQSRGGMFDSQPSLTPGNIYNVNDEKEIVIGYFSVSGLYEKRVFVSRIPGMHIILDDSFCFPGPIPLDPGGLEIYLATMRKPDDEDKLIRGTVQKHCIDCRENRNSSGTPPGFW